ncbi:MFS transporter [Chloroflexota bacterium]
MAESPRNPETVRAGRLWSRTFVSLRYRDFRLVWLGSLAEHVGEFMQLTALLWLMNQLTGSPLLLTLLTACRFMPMVFLSAIGGVAADRVNRRNLLIVALLGSICLSLALAILVFIDRVAWWHLIVIALLGGMAVSLNHPTRQAIVPNLVKREHLMNAVSLDSASVMGALMVAGPIAGYIIDNVGVSPTFGPRAAGFLGVSLVFALRVVGVVITIWLLLLARIPSTPPGARRRAVWQNLGEGLKYVRQHTVVFALLALFLLPRLSGESLRSFLPQFADILHVGATGYGLLMAAFGLGAFLGLIGVASLDDYKRKGMLLFVLGCILGLALIGFSVSPWLLLSLLFLVIAGGMAQTFTAVNATLIQRTIPDEVRGRVMSLREVAFGLGPSGGLLFGVMAEYSGVSYTVGLMGIICFAIPLALAFLLPKVRGL